MTGDLGRYYQVALQRHWQVQFIPGDALDCPIEVGSCSVWYMMTTLCSVMSGLGS